MIEEICKHCNHCLSCLCGDEFKTCYLKKTPHERAKIFLAQYTKQPTAIDLYSKDEVLEMLVKFAIEQRKIDIDKTCEWMEKYMESLGYIDEWCRTGEDKFIKAMEE